MEDRWVATTPSDAAATNEWYRVRSKQLASEQGYSEKTTEGIPLWSSPQGRLNNNGKTNGPDWGTLFI